MEQEFFTMITDIGKKEIANAIANDTKVNFSKIVLGDGGGDYYEITETQTKLKNEVYRGEVSNVTIDEENPYWIKVETALSHNIGGFIVREVGLLDDKDNLIVVAKFPLTYKPISDDGVVKDLLIRMIIEVSNTDVINIKVDPTLVLATKKDLDKKADKDHKHHKADILDFPHTHLKKDILDFPHAHLKADILDFAHTHLKKDILDFPHIHLKADITDFAHTHPTSDIIGLSPFVVNTKVNNSVNTDKVQKFPFRNNNGILEVLVEGEWIPVGGRQYTVVRKGELGTNNRRFDYSGGSGIVRHLVIDATILDPRFMQVLADERDVNSFITYRGSESDAHYEIKNIEFKNSISIVMTGEEYVSARYFIQTQK